MDPVRVPYEFLIQRGAEELDRWAENGRLEEERSRELLRRLAATPVDEIVAAGISREDAIHVITLVQRNEHKRRQSAPGIRITRRAFGRDRRYPITSGWHEESIKKA